MAKRAKKKMVTVHHAVAFGVEHGPVLANENERMAAACYLATSTAARQRPETDTFPMAPLDSFSGALAVEG
jgi:hypothetical protein